MGVLARLSRVVPLIIILAVVAIIVYLVVTYRHSPARAKEVLIKMFSWVFGITTIVFAVISLYALLDKAWVFLELSAAFAAIGVIGWAIVRLCNWRFLKNNPGYRKKRMRASTRRRWPWRK